MGSCLIEGHSRYRAGCEPQCRPKRSRRERTASSKRVRHDGSAGIYRGRTGVVVRGVEGLGGARLGLRAFSAFSAS